MSTHPTEQSPIKKFFDHIKNFLVYENQQGQNDEAFRNIDRCVSDHSESLTNYWYNRFKQGKFNLWDTSESKNSSIIDAEEKEAVIKGHNLHDYGEFDSSESPSTSDSDGYVSGPNDELETNVSKFA